MDESVKIAANMKHYLDCLDRNQLQEYALALLKRLQEKDLELQESQKQLNYCREILWTNYGVTCGAHWQSRLVCYNEAEEEHNREIRER